MTPAPRSYLGTVRRLQVGPEHAAALCDGGRIELHWLGAPPADAPESVLLPEPGAPPATCLALTPHFCVYGDAEGGITYFHLNAWKVLSQFKHVVGVKLVFADPAGTRVFFVDDKDEAFVYTPVNDAVLPVPGLAALAAGAAAVLWDVRPGDVGTFAFVGKDKIATCLVDANHYLGKL